MDIVARQPIRRGDEDAVQTRARCGIAQAVQAWTPERLKIFRLMTDSGCRRLFQWPESDQLCSGGERAGGVE
jgi:hypothetical protein